ncbi:minor structural GP20 protein [Acetivibrio thermocellus ATCC 27405]|uniref:Minor structural GP20 protein n=2 Tax=Acetivibrio thermocellus TaxID=1515 RepID=A3DIA1_ACET2|nr:minor structural GP20 protein [Acetivibrio thermocellus ATCC 27405]
MTKEQLMEMGLTEEQAEKVLVIYKEDLKSFIPKARFDEVNEAKKNLEEQLKDRDKQLKDLGEKVKDNEELTKQIKDLQEANKKAKEEYETKIKNLTLDNAIKLALKEHKAKYEDLLVNKFDREKLVIKDDGTIEGLNEQIAALKENYKDLFEQPLSGHTPNNTGDNPEGGELQQIANTIRQNLGF